MRTTLDIADDVLIAAKELATREHKTAGQVLSELARQALSRPERSSPAAIVAEEPEEYLGFRPFAARGGVVTDDLVNRLRQESDEG